MLRHLPYCARTLAPHNQTLTLTLALIQGPSFKLLGAQPSNICCPLPRLEQWCATPCWLSHDRKTGVLRSKRLLAPPPPGCPHARAQLWRMKLRRRPQEDPSLFWWDAALAVREPAAPADTAPCSPCVTCLCAGATRPRHRSNQLFKGSRKLVCPARCRLSGARPQKQPGTGPQAPFRRRPRSTQARSPRQRRQRCPCARGPWPCAPAPCGPPHGR